MSITAPRFRKRDRRFLSLTLAEKISGTGSNPACASNQKWRKHNENNKIKNKKYNEKAKKS